jgi:hypothetical protein
VVVRPARPPRDPVRPVVEAADGGEEGQRDDDEPGDHQNLKLDRSVLEEVVACGVECAEARGLVAEGAPRGEHEEQPEDER